MRVTIPVDMYESKQELVFVIPLWWVDKASIHLSIEHYKLIIMGERVKPDFKDWFALLQGECYRGPIEQKIDLPSHIVFDKIHSSLTKDNILIITLPKYSVPEKIDVHIED